MRIYAEKVNSDGDKARYSFERSQRYYIQSALRLPSEEKREQEVRSLKSINDSFRKFVITEDLISRYHDNEGITYMNIYEFLLDENSLQI